jgi:predicted anti-sigma-YlaC factor YlaD
MKCKQAYTLIHLHCGSDLSPADASLLQLHLDQCESCQDWQQRMAAPMAALHTLRDAAPETPHSVWPKVSLAIRSRLTHQPIARRFNLQVAAISVCSLLLAAATIVQTLSALRPSGYHENAAWFPAQSPSGNFTNAPWLQSVAAGNRFSQPNQASSDFKPEQWSRGAQDF